MFEIPDTKPSITPFSFVVIGQFCLYQPHGCRRFRVPKVLWLQQGRVFGEDTQLCVNSVAEKKPNPSNKTLLMLASMCYYYQ